MTAAPTLDLKVRATRAVPGLGLAPGQVLDLHIPATFPTNVQWGELVAGLKSGALVDLGPPLTPDGILRFVDAMLDGAR